MENLGIDAKLLLAQVLNFILFFILIKKFIVKPFNVFLDQEKKQDKEKEEALAKIKKSEENILNEQNKAQQKAKKELDIILAQAKKDSQLIKQEMITEAQKEADEIKERMKKQLLQEKEELYKEVKEQIAKVSMYLVENGLKDSLDDNTKKKITVKILKNLSDKTFVQN